MIPHMMLLLLDEGEGAAGAAVVNLYTGFISPTMRIERKSTVHIERLQCFAIERETTGKIERP